MGLELAGSASTVGGKLLGRINFKTEHSECTASLGCVYASFPVAGFRPSSCKHAAAPAAEGEPQAYA